MVYPNLFPNQKSFALECTSEEASALWSEQIAAQADGCMQHESICSKGQNQLNKYGSFVASVYSCADKQVVARGVQKSGQNKHTT